MLDLQPAAQAGLSSRQRQPSASESQRDNAAEFLKQLTTLGLLDEADADSFRASRLPGLHDHNDRSVGAALIQTGLLTQFQLDSILANTKLGLVIGNYRVLDKLGSGGMGDVFLAEHRLMKRLVAIKCMPLDDECPLDVRQRFYAEMRALAELQHPNIVTAFDAGELPPPAPGIPGLVYLVMEHLGGGDLDRRVSRNGPAPVAEACGFIRQAALGLQAAHDIHLVHRDLKPSNLLLTSAGKIKIVDFGLAREFSSRLTDPRALLGSIEYMPPEQSHDPSAVGKPGDIYALGASLFWLLTGQPPYPYAPSLRAALRQLREDSPRRVRDLRPEVPEEVAALVERMLQRNPTLRPVMPLAIANALEPFLVDAKPLSASTAIGKTASGNPGRRVLVVEDDREAQLTNRRILESLDCVCMEANDGPAAVQLLKTERIDLVLLDRFIAGADGLGLLRSLREDAIEPNLKIIIVSERRTPDELGEALALGADDCVIKPQDLAAKVKHAFRLKDAQDKATGLAEELRQVNGQLQQSLVAREADIREAHRALLFAIARLGESRDGETLGHLHRLREYTIALASSAAGLCPSWAGVVDDRFIGDLRLCVPLHDIGKIALPDEVLRKPAQLSESERRLVEQHADIGDRMLESLAKEHGGSLEFLRAARDIVRHHHERLGR